MQQWRTRPCSRRRRSACRTTVKGEVIVVFCRLRPGETDDPELRRSISAKIVEQLGKALRPEAVVVIPTCRAPARARSCAASPARHTWALTRAISRRSKTHSPSRPFAPRLSDSHSHSIEPRDHQRGQSAHQGSRAPARKTRARPPGHDAHRRRARDDARVAGRRHPARGLRRPRTVVDPEARRCSSGCARNRCRCVEVGREAFERLAYGDRLDGVVAVAETPLRTLDELVLPPQPLIGVVEGVEKPGNLGAVLRTADGAGVNAVIVAESATDLFNPNIIRASWAPFSPCRCRSRRPARCSTGCAARDRDHRGARRRLGGLHAGRLSRRGGDRAGQ